MKHFLFLEQEIENEEMEQMEKLIVQLCKSSNSLDILDEQVHSPYELECRNHCYHALVNA